MKEKSPAGLEPTASGLWNAVEPLIRSFSARQPRGWWEKEEPAKDEKNEGPDWKTIGTGAAVVAGAAIVTYGLLKLFGRLSVDDKPEPPEHRSSGQSRSAGQLYSYDDSDDDELDDDDDDDLVDAAPEGLK